MGKITINELHKSLYNYAQAVSDENLMTESKTVVNAINEIYGKQLIANAIGEPLNDTDTFTKMNDDINGLLSTFKTNMMNNGVTVESGDKFKQLIDKIATLADSEGRGIQYATGQGTPTSQRHFLDVIGGSLNLYYLQVNNLTFKPSIILLGYSDPTYGDYTTFYSEELASDRVTLVNTKRDNITLGTLDNVVKSSSCTINSTGFILPVSMVRNYTWIAIGVGEEDTTLRDSLASILEDEGVEVTPEDDMADLIVKVDEEFDRKNANSGLNIISATELPATGKENQICVITDNPNTILMTTDISDISSLSTNTIGCLIKEGKPSNVTEGGLLQITGNNLTYSIYMKYFIQNDSYIPSYIYKNANWEEFTKEQINFIKDGYYVSPNPFGKFVTSFTSSNSKHCLKYNEGKGVVTFYNAMAGYYYMWNTLPNLINFEGYNTIRITAYAKQLSTWTANPMVKFYTTTYSGVASSESKTYFTHPSSVDLVDFQSIPFNTPTDLYFDISSWTGEKYLAMMCYVEEDSSVTGNHIIITDISFM